MDIKNIKTDTLIPSDVIERYYLTITRGHLIQSAEQTPILGFIFPDSFRHIIDPAFIRQLPNLFAINRGVTNIIVKNRFGLFNLSQRTKLSEHITANNHDIHYYYNNTYKPCDQLDRIKLLLNVAHHGNSFYVRNCEKYIIPDWYLEGARV